MPANPYGPPPVQLPALALDLGTTMGWARLGRAGGWQWGQRALQHKGEGQQEVGLRFYRFQQWIETQLAPLATRPQVLFYEDVVHSTGAGAFVIQGQRGILMAACERLGVPYFAVNIQTWKAHALPADSPRHKACRQWLHLWHGHMTGKGKWVQNEKAIYQQALLAQWRERFDPEHRGPTPGLGCDQPFTDNMAEALWVLHCGLWQLEGAGNGR